jgi:hypothetical protein
MSDDAPLTFFAVLRVGGPGAPPEIDGELGYVAGIAERAGVVSVYAWIYARREFWPVAPENLRLLGHCDEIAAAAYRRLSPGGAEWAMESGEGLLR